MECEYATMDDPCERPRYFDDCSDMEVATRDRDGRFYDDIDITLDELIEKVADVPCMVSTRELMFNWAYEIGNLLGLCRGDYDTFCDYEFTNERGEDKCLARKARIRQRRENSSVSDTDYAQSVGSNMADYVNDDFMFDNNNGKLTELQHILISGGINGLIISIIVLMIYYCYKMKNKAHKYDAIDAGYH